ncbi:hypothetical protein [Lutibaculum baratangense]|uniref:Uncharacterized protein n=1 Tax=Lutibaculum baratangense AMV1 TaxID=631454 RepID=V4TJN7_9HYPH|nr:hypothetical protein [Lutibaculum baratangense]ESR26118.1 hypothetical protein N177_1453 [Lutibaculum baratangense AMV1]
MTDGARDRRSDASGTPRRAPILPRLVAVLVGYGAACLMAAFVLLIGASAPDRLWAPGIHISGNLVSSGLFVVGILSVFVAALAAAPAAVGIILGELLVVRNFFYYTIGGGLLAGLGYYAAAARGMMPLTGIEQRTSETILMTAAGLVAGFSYWAVAGRRAGVDRYLRD